MTKRGRVVLGASIVLLGASVALVACVGDDPTASTTTTDASTSDGSTDGPSGTDGTITDTGSSTTPDASDAAVETFDGSNPTCNGLFPQDAPSVATIECDGGTIVGTGGAIQTGRYYLVDEKYPSAFCPSGLTGYSDVIDISSTGDGGLTVNAALNSPALNARLTLAWAVDVPDAFHQYDQCPGTTGPVGPISYIATATTLTYFLAPFGNLTYQKF
jgi:hypothetical protein